MRWLYRVEGLKRPDRRVPLCVRHGSSCVLHQHSGTNGARLLVAIVLSACSGKDDITSGRGFLFAEAPRRGREGGVGGRRDFQSAKQPLNLAGMTCPRSPLQGQCTPIAPPAIPSCQTCVAYAGVQLNFELPRGSKQASERGVSVNDIIIHIPAHPCHGSRPPPSR